MGNTDSTEKNISVENLMDLDRQELAAKVADLSHALDECMGQCHFYKSECESIWAGFAKKKRSVLEISQKIIKNDSKCVANMILNMYNGTMPSDSCSFCEIFGLKETGRCARFTCCTDCIDAFLADYYRKREGIRSDGPYHEMYDQKEAPEPSAENTSCDGCHDLCTETGKINVRCLSCRRQYPYQECWNWKRDLYDDGGKTDGKNN